MNYIIIPKQLIYETELSEKRILIYSYLCCKRSLDDTVGFSISHIVRWSKVKSDFRIGKVNDKYIDVLKILSEFNYFDKYPDFNDFKHSKQCAEQYYELKINRDKFDIPEKFAIIYFDELEKILNFKKELEPHSEINLMRMSSANILLLLSYIRVNMNRQTDKPLCCYRLNKTISNDTGLSEKYISRIIEILDKLNIVKYQEPKRKKYDKNGKDFYITMPKVFADYRRFKKIEASSQILDLDYDYKSELKKQIEIITKESKILQEWKENKNGKN